MKKYNLTIKYSVQTVMTFDVDAECSAMAEAKGHLFAAEDLLNQYGPNFSIDEVDIEEIGNAYTGEDK